MRNPATQALFACKTFQDVVELQTKQAQAGFDKALAQTAKVGEQPPDRPDDPSRWLNDAKWPALNLR